MTEIPAFDEYEETYVPVPEEEEMTANPNYEEEL
jgi:hypothetical protein